MSFLHAAANRPGNRGRLILRLLLDGASSGLCPIDSAADVATTDTMLLAIDSAEVAENGPKRPNIAARSNFAGRPNFADGPLSSPTQN